MVFNKKWILTAFFVVAFAAFAFSQEVFVTLSPLTHTAPVEVYPSEIVEFELVVINNEEEQLNNFNAEVFVGSELALIVNGKEKKEQRLTFVSLDPTSSNKKTIKVKGLNFSNNDLPITVKYGFGDALVNTFSTSIKVSKSPLQVNARLEKTALEPLEENSLLLDLTNTSSAEIKNLSATLIVPAGFVNKSKPLEFSSFAASQAILNSPFKFEAPQEPAGEKTVSLVIRYEDQTGVHVIEKNFVVDVREREQFLFLLGGIVIVLLLISLYLSTRKKESVQEPQEAVQEEAREEKVEETEQITS